MALCPLLKEECIKGRCSWWNGKWQGGTCYVTLTGWHVNETHLHVASIDKNLVDTYNLLVDLEK